MRRRKPPGATRAICSLRCERCDDVVYVFVCCVMSAIPRIGTSGPASQPRPNGTASIDLNGACRPGEASHKRGQPSKLTLATTVLAVFRNELLHDADRTAPVPAAKQRVMIQMMIELVQRDAILVFLGGLRLRHQRVVL